jgi:hypothetical protein
VEQHDNWRRDYGQVKKELEMLKAAGKTIFILGWATMHAQKCSNMHHEVSLMNSCAFNPKQAMRHQLVLGLSSQNATLTASSLLLRMAPLLPVVRVYARVPVCSDTICSGQKEVEGHCVSILWRVMCLSISGVVSAP